MIDNPSVGPRTPPVVWALALVGPLLLLGPMIAGGGVLFWGTPLLQFVPWHNYAVDVVRHGALPLWNPYVGAGAPLLANLQSALLYPPNWLLLLIDPAVGHGLLLLLHLIWTAAGMVLLARGVGAGPLGQVVAAQAWSLSTFLVSRSGFLSLIAAAAWVPWVLLAALAVARETAAGWGRPPTRRAIVIFGVALAFQLLAGHAQTTWYAFLLAAAFVVFESSRLKSRWLLGLGAVAIGAVLAVVLSAVQLLPTAEYLLQSSRAGGLDPSTAMTYSFWPWRLLGMLLPDLFGNPAAGDFWGYGNYWEDALYIGVIPLLMAATAWTRRKRLGPRLEPWPIFLLAVALLAFLLALGSNTPLFPFLYRWVPTFRFFNAPARWNVITVMCLALLAGLGADMWSSPSPRGVYWKRLAAAGGVAMVAAAWLVRMVPLDLRPSLPHAFSTLGWWVLLTAILQLRWPKGDDRRWWILVGVLVAADLYAANVGLVPSTSRSVYTSPTRLKTQVDDGHRLYLPADLEYEVKFERTHRFDTFDPGIDWLLVREAGLPNTSMLDSTPTFNNFDPLLSAAYVDWVSLIERVPEPRRAGLLALADIGWVGEGDPAAPAWVVYRSVAGSARARIVPQAQPVPGREAALAALGDPGFELAAKVLLESTADGASLSTGRTGTAAVEASGNPDVVRVHARADDGGWLLLSDAWYPGWTATVDGVRVTVYRADGMFRAVWIPSGEHEVEFVYQPVSFALGFLLSALGWGGLLLWWRRA